MVRTRLSPGPGHRMATTSSPTIAARGPDPSSFPTRRQDRAGWDSAPWCVTWTVMASWRFWEATLMAIYGSTRDWETGASLTPGHFSAMMTQTRGGWGAGPISTGTVLRNLPLHVPWLMTMMPSTAIGNWRSTGPLVRVPTNSNGGRGSPGSSPQGTGSLRPTPTAMGKMT